MYNYVLVVDLRFNMGLLCIMTFKTYKFYIYVKVKKCRHALLALLVS